MSKRTKLPQSDHHVVIYDEDWEYLESRFGSSGIKPVGVSAVIRGIIHSRVLAWREAENRAYTERIRERNNTEKGKIDA